MVLVEKHEIQDELFQQKEDLFDKKPIQFYAKQEIHHNIFDRVWNSVVELSNAACKDVILPLPNLPPEKINLFYDYHLTDSFSFGLSINSSLVVAELLFQ